MNYQQTREKVESLFYVPLKSEGAPVHPAGWTVADGINYKEWYENQINAYIKHVYNVTPSEEI